MFKMISLLTVMAFSLTMGIATQVSGMVWQVQSANRYAATENVLHSSDEAGNFLQPTGELQLSSNDSGARLFENLENPQKAGRNGL